MEDTFLLKFKETANFRSCSKCDGILGDKYIMIYILKYRYCGIQYHQLILAINLIPKNDGKLIMYIDFWRAPQTYD